MGPRKLLVVSCLFVGGLCMLALGIGISERAALTPQTVRLASSRALTADAGWWDSDVIYYDDGSSRYEDVWIYEEPQGGGLYLQDDCYDCIRSATMDPYNPYADLSDGGEWVPVDIYENEWVPVDIYQDEWAPIDIYTNGQDEWEPIDVYENYNVYRQEDEYWNVSDPYYDEYVLIEEPWYDRALPGGYSSVARNIVPGLSSLFTSAIQPTVIRPAPVVPQQPRYPVPYCTLFAQPTNVRYGGSTILSWHSSYGTSASLSSIGAVPPSGSRSVNNLTGATTFTLNVSGPGGSTVCDTYVDVAEPVGPPSCVISTHPESIRRGEQASLVWGSENAVVANLDGLNVSGQGARTIAPSKSQTYTLAVRSEKGATASCQASITVR